MKRLISKLTYANVMVTVLAFVVLAGGSAYAAGQLGKNSVGAKQLKKNAVSTAKIKNSAVTAAKIRNKSIGAAKLDLASLGTVPSAATAARAATAETAAKAGNADTVNGRTITKVFAKIPKGSKVTIGSFGFVTISAECQGSGAIESFKVIPNTTESDLTGSSIGNAGTTFSQASGGQSLELDEGGNDNARGVATFAASTSTGAVVSGVLSFQTPNTFDKEEVCAIYGDVTS